LIILSYFQIICFKKDGYHSTNVCYLIDHVFKKEFLILVTNIQLMIINMIQVQHRLIHLMQVMNQVHLTQHLEPMKDMQHQELIRQVKDLIKSIEFEQFYIV